MDSLSGTNLIIPPIAGVPRDWTCQADGIGAYHLHKRWAPLCRGVCRQRRCCQAALFVFQMAKNFFKQLPHRVLVLFLGGEFQELTNLVSISQMCHISRHMSQPPGSGSMEKDARIARRNQSPESCTFLILNYREPRKQRAARTDCASSHLGFPQRKLPQIVKVACAKGSVSIR